MPNTAEALLAALDAYPWWQLKRHKIKGVVVHTCTIQSTKDKRSYHTACSAISVVVAMTDALAVAKEA